MTPALRLCLLLPLLALMPACATITTGSTQNVTVMTEPPGAACTLTRDGATLGVVRPTPGTINISRSHRDIGIACQADGRQNASGVLASQLQAMTAGNLLLGGVVGVAIDAASGASARYPETFTLALPAAQPSARQVAQLRLDETRASYNARIDAQRASCTRGSACQRELRTLEAERDREVLRLERDLINAPAT